MSQLEYGNLELPIQGWLAVGLWLVIATRLKNAFQSLRFLILTKVPFCRVDIRLKPHCLFSFLVFALFGCVRPPFVSAFCGTATKDLAFQCL